MQQQASQIRVVNAAVLQQLQAQQQAESGATIVAGHQAQVARDHLGVPSPATVQQQPQVITLSQLQNFLPIHHQSGQHHVTAVASTESTAHGQQQTTPGPPGVKTFVSSAAAVTPTVVSVQGVSGQFLQVCCICEVFVTWRHIVCHVHCLACLIGVQIEWGMGFISARFQISLGICSFQCDLYDNFSHIVT